MRESSGATTCWRCVGSQELLLPASLELDPRLWHCPKNEREYLRSPQRAQWRSAKEGKMDQYKALKVYRLISRLGIDPKKIMGSLWAYKISYDDKGVFAL